MEFIHKNTNGSFLENWRDKTDVLTLHPNAAKSLMDCISQRLAYPEYVPDCCITFEDLTEHYLGFDYYFRCFNEEEDGKICLGKKQSPNSSVFGDHLYFKSDDELFEFHGILSRLENVLFGLKYSEPHTTHPPHHYPILGCLECQPHYRP